MQGAGFAYRGKRFITHTTLTHHESAIVTFKRSQKIFWALAIIFVLLGFIANAQSTLVVLIAVLSLLYFIDVLFNLFLILKSLYYPPEVSVLQQNLLELANGTLPIYTILCPLYKEARVLDQFVQSIESIDWPKNKLDVQLLLEEDDKETIQAARHMHLPSYFRIVVTPDSQPKTKPKACNYGLHHAKGEYIVIYDAEDKPDPLQLKKAYAAFQTLPHNVACLQAKLNYYNPHHNLLTRLFTAEYSLWFDVTLPGLQAIETSIPLGGTSNHFRTSILRSLHGWDAFNVTEDCDLGVRLFKKGYRTAIIDSTTLEEANSNVLNWIRQRSRWIKGYMQTYFIHTRNPLSFLRSHGIHSLLFHLIVGGKIAFILINPILWVATISYFALYAYVGPAIERLYPTIVFYMAVISLVFGNFLCMYYYMIGCAKREHWKLIKFVYLVPFYWLMVSVAAGVAGIQLLVKPHYWEKTKHGLHLGVGVGSQKSRVTWPRLSSMGTPAIRSAGVLIGASLIGNVLNFFYNSYLGRVLPIETFGLIALFGTFLYVMQIPVGALGRTITHRSGYLLGKYGIPMVSYWKFMLHAFVPYSMIATIVWFLITPFLSQFFHIPTLTPLILFSPIWLFGAGVAVNIGFMTGNQLYAHVALLILFEAVTKLAATVILVHAGLEAWVYGVIPLSLAVNYIAGTYLIVRTYARSLHTTDTVEGISYFPKKFFASSILGGLTTVGFLTFDVMLVKHFMSPQDAGHYGLLSLIGKMIFFVGYLFNQFVNPVISKEIGAGRDSTKPFYKLLLLTITVCTCGVFIIGMFGNSTVPLLFGRHVESVVTHLLLYTAAMACFTVASAIVTYHQVHKEYVYQIASFALSALQIVGIFLFHDSLREVVFVMFISGLSQLTVITLMHLLREQIRVISVNTLDFFGLFQRLSPKNKTSGNLRILIFNWRDTRHVWAGGAEVYLHEIAKRWVRDGNTVTVFCGNDGKTPRNEMIDGVQMVRRGGFYTVYVWAFLYYILKFRGLFDVVIDSENGIPFFTPLYVRVPTFLLIHHVHQEVFRENLRFPLWAIATFVESTCMPLLYRGMSVITVSESSKKDIISYKLAKEESIRVVTPGITTNSFAQGTKTPYPSIIYLGRLKKYKNIDVAIRAFAHVHKHYPKAQFAIAGTGEVYNSLKNLVKKLNIEKCVRFTGSISEREKRTLLSTRWVAVQPSSYEGWSITVIEANAAGTPVIASDVNGLRDSVVDKKTGILVPAHNVMEFAGAIDLIFTNKILRNTLSREAFEWSKSFDWDKSAEDFFETITSVIGRQERPATSKKEYSFANSVVDL